MRSRYRLHHAAARAAAGKHPGCGLYLAIDDVTLLQDSHNGATWDTMLINDRLDHNGVTYTEVSGLAGFATLQGLAPKARLLTRFEFQIAIGKKPPYWAIYDTLSDKFLGKEYEDPSEIDFVVHPVKELQPVKTVVKGDRVRKVFYQQNDNGEWNYPILEKQYQYQRNGKLPEWKNKDYFWYKSDGSKQLLISSGPNYFATATEAESHETRRRENIVAEMKAEIRGTPLETPAIAWLNQHATEVNNFVKSGTDEFRQAVLAADRTVETWMDAPTTDADGNPTTFGDVAAVHLNIYATT